LYTKQHPNTYIFISIQYQSSKNY